MCVLYIILCPFHQVLLFWGRGAGEVRAGGGGRVLFVSISMDGGGGREFCLYPFSISIYMSNVKSKSCKTPNEEMEHVEGGGPKRRELGGGGCCCCRYNPPSLLSPLDIYRSIYRYIVGENEKQKREFPPFLFPFFLNDKRVHSNYVCVCTRRYYM